MFFRKLSLILSITLLIFSSSVISTYALNFKNPNSINKELVKELETIDNEMSLLIKSISSKNLNKDNLQNQIKHIELLINNLNKKASMLPKEEKDVSIAVNSILNFYQLSLLSAQDYLKNSQSEDLVDTISDFSIGYYSLTSIRNILVKSMK